MDYIDYLKKVRDDIPDDDLIWLKAEAAWALGLEEGSEEWEELMEI